MRVAQHSRKTTRTRVADRLRRLNARHPWNHNQHFHSWVLANLPTQRRSAYDVGCGTGELAAALAPYFATVVGNDRDCATRRFAAKRCLGLPNVSIVGESWESAEGPFDLITMIAVLHHLDTAHALNELRRMLAPGGRLLVVGLARPRSISDYAWEVASIVTNPLIGFIKHPWPSDGTPEAVEAPLKEPTLTFNELQRLVQHVMPEATMRHHLGFRHAILWTKPQ